MLEKSKLEAAFSWCHQNDIPLIADEIQCGLYRTEKLAAAHLLDIEPDIYCFAKALGGGIAKIGLTVVKDSFLVPQLYRLHSSSFAGDYFSTKIAQRSLEFLQKNRDTSLIDELKKQSH